jgi:hypothetical protein
MCQFCGRGPTGSYAVTVLRATGEWERLFADCCQRCHKLLRVAGDKGRKLKSTGDRWLLGHGHGAYPPPSWIGPGRE